MLILNVRMTILGYYSVHPRTEEALRKLCMARTHTSNAMSAPMMSHAMFNVITFGGRSFSDGFDFSS